MKVFAHRGYSGRYPENTMLAFQKAWEIGSDGIELDVQLSKDGHIVIIHDEDLIRTTGQSGRVRDYTLAELQAMDASFVWQGKHSKTPIPSLEEYLQWAQDKPLCTNIEIKSSVYYYADLEEKTLDLVRKYALSDRVIFSSFNHSSISLLRTLAPEIPCAALVETIGLGNAGYYCKKFDYAYYHPGWQNLTEEDMLNCREYGVPINVWTINDMDNLQKMCEWNLAGVITNFPEVCLQYLKSLKR